MTWIVIGAIILALGATVMGVYNKLVSLKNRYMNAFAQIEVQLKRRYDLIPNLVETVKGYMAHERETLEAVIEARNQAMSGLQRAASDPGDPNAIKNLSSAEGALGGALGRLFALSEAYPDLKASENMFPPVIFAGMFGHTTDASLLEFDSAAIAEAPKVSFS